MAVFFDLDDDDGFSISRSRGGRGSISHECHPPRQQYQLKPLNRGGSGGVEGPGHEKNIQVEEPLVPNKLAAVLTCYPVALSVSSHLDLNDLHALAATCRSVHTSLTQYAGHLKHHSLRCINDGRPVLTDALAAKTDEPYVEDNLGFAAVSQADTSIAPPWAQLHPEGLYASLGVSSKISSCARDLVAPCRRCGIVVCRNCVAKSPSNARMKERFRRVCKTCVDAPISAHLQLPGTDHETTESPPASSANSMRSQRSFSGCSASSSTSVLEGRHSEPEFDPTFTTSAFLRGPCTCESRGVFLCAPCGHNLCAADTTYKRVWTWRSRYSTHIGGGLGTGLGEGNQGQKCGRGEDCLETGGKAVCWVEIDCSEGNALDAHREHDRSGSSRAGTPDSSYSSNKPGYLQQEIEGIGGVVKKKVKKRVKVGATVWEYDDERESGKYLEREAQGTTRSWCGWCGRVCLGELDRQDSSWLSLPGMTL